jgi:hypothetical protein
LPEEYVLGHCRVTLMQVCNLTVLSVLRGACSNIDR